MAGTRKKIIVAPVDHRADFINELAGRIAYWRGMYASTGSRECLEHAQAYEKVLGAKLQSDSSEAE